MVLRLIPCSPRRANSCCHRHWRIKGSSNPVGSDFASASLAPATGVGTTRLCRPLKRRSSRAPQIAHEVHLALRLPLRAWRSRVHRIPSRVRDDARSAPLWNETVRDIEVIWVRPERKYFCKWGWTGDLKNGDWRRMGTTVSSRNEGYGMSAHAGKADLIQRQANVRL